MKKEHIGTIQEYLNIANVIFIVIQKNHTVELINKKGCDILGYEKEEIIGKNWVDNFIPPEDRENIKKVFNQIIKGRLEEVESEGKSIKTS